MFAQKQKNKTYILLGTLQDMPNMLLGNSNLQHQRTTNNNFKQNTSQN